MWQRIQTLFMLLTAVLMLATIFLPIWEKTGDGQEVLLTAQELVHTSDQTTVAEHTQTTIYLAILAGLTALLSVYTILMYKKRLLQIKLNALNSILIAIFVGVAFFWVSTAEDWFLPAAYGTYLAGAYLPLVALLSNMLATRFIKKDEQLVRSMDRLR